MSVKIRLARHGSKKRAFYRVVAADSRYSRDGRFIEHVGTYDPRTNPASIKLKMNRIQYWLDNGATASGTVLDLIKRTRKQGTQEGV